MDTSIPSFSGPALLCAEHPLADFSSGEPVLDDWLQRRALANQVSGASRTYVLLADEKVIAYYSLATGAIAHAVATRRVKQNMPDPIPVMLLARLAVDRRWQGQGIGALLLRDAILRTLQAADIAGIRALLAHALHDRAAKFYEKFGFRPSPLHPHTLMITLAEAQKALALNPEK